MAVNYAAFAPDFGSILSASPHLRPQQNPFSEALSRRENNAAGLMDTGMQGLFAGDMQRSANQAAEERQRLAGDNALEQIAATGKWAIKGIEANQAANRRAGLLAMLSGGSFLGSSGGGPRMAGTALGLNPSAPFARVADTFGGVAGAFGGVRGLFGSSVEPFGAPGAGATEGALRTAPRPPSLM
jgi:hypothetical protein